MFEANGESEWMASHAVSPTVYLAKSGALRVYFGTRDRSGHTTITFLEVDRDDPSRVTYLHDAQVLGFGKRGCFDDSGVGPSCIVERSDGLYLYYTGISPSVSVAYRVAVGLAISTDGGLTFHRISDGPILDRSIGDPYLCNSPFVLHDDGIWKMWYGSGTGWPIVHGKPEPAYELKYAESTDGISWHSVVTPAVAAEYEGEAICRPFVVREHGRYRIWYCYRGSMNFRTSRENAYRIGYAESSDGRSFERIDDAVGITRSEDGWDSVMQAYPVIFDHHGSKHMFYNGNGFGASGFGLAVLEADESASDTSVCISSL